MTKPKGTGGVVSVGSVSEQIIYEIMNPSEYILPDVVCDWTNVIVKQVGHDRVLVTGAKGLPPTPYYKVGATSMNGFSASASLLVSGFDAREKAEAVSKGILEKCRRILSMRRLGDFSQVAVHYIGAESSYGPHATAQTREVLLYMSVQHPNPKALAVFGMEIAPCATGMAPGLFGIAGARPKPTPCIRYHSCLIRKEDIQMVAVVGEKQIEIDSNEALSLSSNTSSSKRSRDNNLRVRLPIVPDAVDTVQVPLLALCFGRSGDKGDNCNIGLIAREPRFESIIYEQVTGEAVKSYLGHLIKGKVTRYHMPGLHAFNYVCTQALGGGGTQSLALDRQGKAYAQKLLSMKVDVPKNWISSFSYASSPRPAKL